MSPDQAYELLQRLQGYFDKTLSADQGREYLIALRKLEFSIGTKAIERAISELEFFPKIAKLNEFAKAEMPSEGQSPRGQVVNISDFDFWAFIENDKLGELSDEQYTQYCTDHEYRGQTLAAWREEWVQNRASS